MWKCVCLWLSSRPSLARPRASALPATHYCASSPALVVGMRQSFWRGPSRQRNSIPVPALWTWEVKRDAVAARSPSPPRSKGCAKPQRCHEQKVADSARKDCHRWRGDVAAARHNMRRVTLCRRSLGKANATVPIERPIGDARLAFCTPSKKAAFSLFTHRT